MMWKVSYTQKALQDIDDIYGYISNVLLEPNIAKSLVSHIMKYVRSLEQLPMRYKIYDNEPWKSKGLRVMSVKNYLVFYLPSENEQTVYVVRIMYAGRDVSKQLSE